MGITGSDVQKQGSVQGNGPIVQPSSVQENEALMRKMFNALNERTVSRMLPFLSDNVTVVNIPVNRTYQGHAGYGEYLHTYITAFPDYRLELTNIICTADKCAMEFTARATHTGTLRAPTGSVPATNKRIEVKFSESYDLMNGRVAKIRSYWDLGSMMSQLGLTPRPE